MTTTVDFKLSQEYPAFEGVNLDWSTQRTRQLVSTAYHESSHFILSHNIGFDIRADAAEIDPENFGGEATHYTQPNAPDVAAFAIGVAPDVCRDRLQALYYGLRDMPEITGMSAPDMRKIRDRVIEFDSVYRIGWEKHPVLRDARILADNILRQNWALVEVVAERLIEDNKVHINQLPELEERAAVKEIQLRDNGMYIPHE